MLDDNRVNKLTLLKPDGCRSVGRPKLRGMDEHEDDLTMLIVRGGRLTASDRKEWKSFLEVTRAQTGL
jgi:hypothetical protein